MRSLRNSLHHFATRLGPTSGSSFSNYLSLSTPCPTRQIVNWRKSGGELRITLSDLLPKNRLLSIRIVPIIRYAINQGSWSFRTLRTHQRVYPQVKDSSVIRMALGDLE